MRSPDVGRMTPLLRKLASIAAPSQADLDAIASLPITIQTFAAEQDIVMFGQETTQCCVLLEGWVCRYHVLRGGERQIINVYIAGDLPDIQSLLLPRMDHSLSALTPTTLAFVSHDSLRELIARQPSVGNLLWRSCLVDAATSRERITSLGRRPALARIAHLFCELFLRLRAVGLAEGLTFSLPIRQSDISDMLGLTSVHVSRTMQEIKRRSLASLYRRTLTIHDWNGLLRTGEFDPTYLHLDRNALRLPPG